jgi:hypothetical protein
VDPVDEVVRMNPQRSYHPGCPGGFRRRDIGPAFPPPASGWRALLTVISLLAVAAVPGAAMAAGSITVAASAICGYGSFCLYSGPDFTGQRAEFDRGQLFCQDARPGLDVASVLPEGARSVFNNTGPSVEGLGVKVYNELGRVVLPTVAPGREVRVVDDETARAMHTLCAYPKRSARG